MNVEIILKQLLILSSFYLCYHLLLRSTTFHHLKRGYLLLSLLVSTLPFMGLPTFTTVNSPIVEELSAFSIKPIEVLASQVAGGASTPYSNYFFSLYLIGFFGFTALFLLKLVRFISLFKSSKPSSSPRIRILQADKAPCSFLTWSFIPSNLDGALKDQVITHEKEHIRQKHTLDILFVEVLKIIFWFNPLVHFIKIELVQIHEFLADKTSSKQFSTYTENMLTYIKWKNAGLLASSINPQFVQLKNRINMLHQQPSASTKKLLFLLVFPLFFSAIFITACEDKQEVDTPQTIDLADLSEVDEMAEFPGGMEAMGQFIGDNIEYPKADKEAQIEGAVLVQFIISDAGQITQAKALDFGKFTSYNSKDGTKTSSSKATEAMTKEAIRVIETMPDWKPAQKEGKSVAVQFSLPIRFQLK